MTWQTAGSSLAGILRKLDPKNCPLAHREQLEQAVLRADVDWAVRSRPKLFSKIWRCINLHKLAKFKLNCFLLY